MTVLVTGATGNTGGPLVELLLRKGVPVRAMVRSEAAAARFAGTPVTSVVADFDDSSAVAAALAGVDRAYLVTPSSERAQAQQERFAELAAAAGAATGREIAFADVPPEAFAAYLRSVLPPWQVDGLLEDYAHYARGEAAAVLPTVREVTGREPRTLGEFAADHAAAFMPG